MQAEQTYLQIRPLWDFTISLRIQIKPNVYQISILQNIQNCWSNTNNIVSFFWHGLHVTAVLNRKADLSEEATTEQHGSVQQVFRPWLCVLNVVDIKG